MKHTPVRLLAALLLGAHLPGCAWLMGHAEPPQPRSPARPLPAAARTTSGPLTLDATWLGVGERIVTARNAAGRAARVVNPYGEDSYVVEIVARAGAEAAVLLPERATLATDDGGRPVASRTLAAFRARWPGWAVTSDEEEADRVAAYNHVLDTLLLERSVPAGGTATGRLAFPVFPPRRTLTLALPYRIGMTTRTATLTWEGL